jgi:acylphosphatase
MVAAKSLARSAIHGQRKIFTLLGHYHNKLISRALKTLMTDHSAHLETLHLIIHGHVQGVFFRNSMRREAQNLRVTGWVRNRSDGTVEATVQGTPDAVDVIVHWAHHGPPMAEVKHIVTEPGTGNYSMFQITS